MYRFRYSPIAIRPRTSPTSGSNTNSPSTTKNNNNNNNEDNDNTSTTTASSSSTTPKQLTMRERLKQYQAQKQWEKVSQTPNKTPLSSSKAKQQQHLTRRHSSAITTTTATATTTTATPRVHHPSTPLHVRTPFQPLTRKSMSSHTNTNNNNNNNTTNSSIQSQQQATTATAAAVSERLNKTMPHMSTPNHRNSNDAHHVSSRPSPYRSSFGSSTYRSESLANWEKERQARLNGDTSIMSKRHASIRFTPTPLRRSLDASSSSSSSSLLSIASSSSASSSAAASAATSAKITKPTKMREKQQQKQQQQSQIRNVDLNLLIQCALDKAREGDIQQARELFQGMLSMSNLSSPASHSAYYWTSRAQAEELVANYREVVKIYERAEYEFSAEPKSVLNEGLRKFMSSRLEESEEDRLTGVHSCDVYFRNTKIYQTYLRFKKQQKVDREVLLEKIRLRTTPRSTVKSSTSSQAATAASMTLLSPSRSLLSQANARSGPQRALVFRDDDDDNNDENEDGMSEAVTLVNKEPRMPSQEQESEPETTQEDTEQQAESDSHDSQKTESNANNDNNKSHETLNLSLFHIHPVVHHEDAPSQESMPDVQQEQEPEQQQSQEPEEETRSVPSMPTLSSQETTTTVNSDDEHVDDIAENVENEVENDADDDANTTGNSTSTSSTNTSASDDNITATTSTLTSATTTSMMEDIDTAQQENTSLEESNGAIDPSDELVLTMTSRQQQQREAKTPSRTPARMTTTMTPMFTPAPSFFTPHQQGEQQQQEQQQHQNNQSLENLSTPNLLFPRPSSHDARISESEMIEIPDRFVTPRSSERKRSAEKAPESQLALLSSRGVRFDEAPFSSPSTVFISRVQTPYSKEQPTSEEMDIEMTADLASPAASAHSSSAIINYDSLLLFSPHGQIMQGTTPLPPSSATAAAARRHDDDSAEEALELADLNLRRELFASDDDESDENIEATNQSNESAAVAHNDNDDSEMENQQVSEGEVSSSSISDAMHIDDDDEHDDDELGTTSPLDETTEMTLTIDIEQSSQSSEHEEMMDVVDHDDDESHEEATVPQDESMRTHPPRENRSELELEISPISAPVGQDEDVFLSSSSMMYHRGGETTTIVSSVTASTSKLNLTLYETTHHQMDSITQPPSYLAIEAPHPNSISSTAEQQQQEHTEQDEHESPLESDLNNNNDRSVRSSTLSSRSRSRRNGRTRDSSFRPNSTVRVEKRRRIPRLSKYVAKDRIDFGYGH